MAHRVHKVKVLEDERLMEALPKPVSITGQLGIGHALAPGARMTSRALAIVSLGVLALTANASDRVDSPEQIPKDSVVPVARDGTPISIVQRDNRRRYIVFNPKNRPESEIQSMGIFHVGAQSSNQGVMFGLYLDEDVDGPLFLVRGTDLPKARGDLIRTGTTQSALAHFANSNLVDVPTGEREIYGPYFLVPCNDCERLDASGSQSMIISPNQLRRIDPVLFVDGRNLRAGEVPLDVLEQRVRDKVRDMEQRQERENQWRDARDDQTRDRARRGIDLLPKPKGRGGKRFFDVAAGQVLDQLDEAARRGRERDDRVHERERQAEWGAFRKEKDRRRMMDQLVIPVGVIPAHAVNIAEGVAVFSESDMLVTDMVKGKPEVVVPLIMPNIRDARDPEIIGGKLTTGDAIRHNLEGDDQLRVVRPSGSSGGQDQSYYVVSVKDLRESAQHHRGVIKVRRGLVQGPYGLVFGPNIAPELDHTLFNSYYRGVEGPIPQGHVMGTLYKMMDTDNDNFVSAGEIGSYLRGFNPDSVERTMRAIAGGSPKPVRAIGNQSELGRGGGFFLAIEDKDGIHGLGGTDYHTIGRISVYGSYADAWVARAEMGNAGNDVVIVGSAVL